MVEIPRRGQHHRITAAGECHHGECKSQIAAGGDGDIGGADPRFIGARHIGGQGFAQRRFAFNRAIAGRLCIPRCGGQPREQFRMRRIARHCLGQIEHRPSAPLVAGGPAAHGRNGRGAGGADAGGKRQIHQRKEPSPRSGVHGAIGCPRGIIPRAGLPSRHGATWRCRSAFAPQRKAAAPHPPAAANAKALPGQ